MTNFQQLSNQILSEGDIKISSPNPKIYELFKMDNGLYKRVYDDGFILISKDKYGNIFHNLDGPAILTGSIMGYYIDGISMSKEKWEKARSVYNVPEEYKKQALDILDI
jgi:hypothetical protein